MLHNPCVLGGPHQRGLNQKWLPHPCLLGAHMSADVLRNPGHSRGSPSKGTRMACVGSLVVKCSEGWSLRAARKRKIFWFLKDCPDQKWPKSGTLAKKVHILNIRGNFSPTGVVV